MNESQPIASAENRLLPSGLTDLLPPEAELLSHTLHHLTQRFGQFGYALVQPPLMEYADTLLSGKGVAYQHQVFRVMDPQSQSMLALRADITMQVARIATSRLEAESRPLRLAYGGTTVRTKPETRAMSRQFTQAGIELFGGEGPEADAEVIRVAALALESLGLHNLTIDINAQGLLEDMLAATKLEADKLHSARVAVSTKDTGALEAMGLKDLAEMTQLSGPADKVLQALGKLPLAKTYAKQLEPLQALCTQLQEQLPDINITLDPLEVRGFEYHTGVSFSIFLNDPITEIGRGGSYVLEDGSNATGCTLYVDTLLRVLKPLQPGKRLLISAATDSAQLQQLQQEGYVTVLARGKADAKEATRQQCNYWWDGSAAQPAK